MPWMIHDNDCECDDCHWPAFMIWIRTPEYHEQQAATRTTDWIVFDNWGILPSSGNRRTLATLRIWTCGSWRRVRRRLNRILALKFELNNWHVLKFEMNNWQLSLYVLKFEMNIWQLSIHVLFLQVSAGALHCN